MTIPNETRKSKLRRIACVFLALLLAVSMLWQSTPVITSSAAGLIEPKIGQGNLTMTSWVLSLNGCQGLDYDENTTKIGITSNDPADGAASSTEHFLDNSRLFVYYIDFTDVWIINTRLLGTAADGTAIYGPRVNRS